MIEVLHAAQRGHFDHGWLDTFHTFSFADYHDPDRMGFRSLRVMNEDRVAAGMGFGEHPHRDIEIVTYVLEGALAHRDSTGGEGTIRAGEVQRITAGTGLTHSEFNASTTEPVHFYQIWLFPDRKEHTPGYQQTSIPAGDGLRLVASPGGEAGSLSIHQDARISLAGPGAATSLLRPGRYAWIQAVRGTGSVLGVELRQGDGASISGVEALELDVDAGSELMIFDLP